MPLLLSVQGQVLPLPWTAEVLQDRHFLREPGPLWYSWFLNRNLREKQATGMRCRREFRLTPLSCLQWMPESAAKSFRSRSGPGLHRRIRP